MSERRKRKSSKVNLVISMVFHAVLVLGITFLAAREGILGNRMKTIVAEMVKKEKPPEPPKEKTPEPKVETAKAAEAPKTTVPAIPPRVETVAPPPPSEAAPAVAPAAVNLAAFNFSDGAKEVQTISDPKLIYKATVERALRARWNRPEDMADDQFVAEVELNIDPKGNVTGSRWVKGSGDSRWDNSVKVAVAATKVISTPPPKGFPGTFLARFDVEAGRTEEVLQLSQNTSR